MNNKTTERWITKAEHDFTSAAALIKLRTKPGEEPNRAEAKHAIKSMTEARKLIHLRMK
jgi:hypothetical protein